MSPADLIAFLESSRYVLLFTGSYIEGSVVMMTGGLLLRLGSVEFWPMYAALFLGDFLSDMMWYAIGYFGARKFILRWGHWMNVTPPVLNKIEERFRHYHLRILVISKLTMGFGFAAGILATAGMLRVSIWRFMTINILAGIPWVLFLVGIGYYFGNVLELIPRNLQIIFAIGLVIGFFLFIRFVSGRLAKTDW